MNLIKVNIKDLKNNPFNPPQRVNKNTGSYKSLISSISRAGQIEPITISTDNTIINGTRRVTVMKELGHETVFANQSNSDSSKMFDEMFLECNVVEKISGAQWAWRYLQKAPVPKLWKTLLDNLKKVGGISCLRRIVDLNLSPMSFSAGLSMFRNYTGINDKRTLKKAIYWMLYVDSAYRMKFLISEYVPVQLLLNAVENRTHIILDGNWTESGQTI
tara:strand:- start:749 stop:1399 length:651 start_codon:yes stop_codon:yes gene_type:complete